MNKDVKIADIESVQHFKDRAVLAVTSCFTVNVVIAGNLSYGIRNFLIE